MSHLATSALAAFGLHPGHGATDPSSFRHYLSEPLHVAVLGGAAIVAIAVLRLAWRRARSE